MNQTQKNEIENFKAILKQHIGEFRSIDELLQKIIQNGINLALIDCDGFLNYLHEPSACDCLV